MAGDPEEALDTKIGSSLVAAKNRYKGKGNLDQLPARRAQEIRIERHGAHYHLDDEAYELSNPNTMDIQVVQKRLDFLAE